MRVDAVSYETASRAIFERIEAGETGYVCVANVHMVMEAHDDPAFAAAVNAATLVVPDGMPLVWALRVLGVRGAAHVRGADLTRVLAVSAAARGVPVGLYGGRQDVADAFADALRRIAPGLEVAVAIAPPFRPLAVAEQAALVEELRASGAQLLFVGLGCPKQERWMASHVADTGAVAVGVGAAFDFFAGRVREAPPWLQALGLEWAFRLAMEPRRLFARYARHNPRFVALFAAQWLRWSVGSRRSRS
jgi:N-acetylglucosaminyldiphosphoundecaprenol N-acetyl-beta-D-mannosaminyltransferase